MSACLVQSVDLLASPMHANSRVQRFNPRANNDLDSGFLPSSVGKMSTGHKMAYAASGAQHRK